MVLSLDLAERTLQSIPLRLVLLTSLSDGDGVFEGGIVAPEGKLLQGRAAGEEIEDRADNGLLLRGKRYTGGGLNVCVLDLERGLVRNTWYSFSFACSVMVYNNKATVSLPVDIFAVVENLESCETTGFVVCLSDALQVRAIVNGRIDMFWEGYLYVRLFVRILYMQSAISCDAFPTLCAESTTSSVGASRRASGRSGLNSTNTRCGK